MGMPLEHSEQLRGTRGWREDTRQLIQLLPRQKPLCEMPSAEARARVCVTEQGASTGVGGKLGWGPQDAPPTVLASDVLLFCKGNPHLICLSLPIYYPGSLERLNNGTIADSVRLPGLITPFLLNGNKSGMIKLIKGLWELFPSWQILDMSWIMCSWQGDIGCDPLAVTDPLSKVHSTKDYGEGSQNSQGVWNHAKVGLWSHTDMNSNPDFLLGETTSKLINLVWFVFSHTKGRNEMYFPCWSWLMANCCILDPAYI
jgi:hypothetical protein